MKKYEICIESYYSNNSDFKENVLTTWNKESKGIIYNIFDLWEMEL